MKKYIFIFLLSLVTGISQAQRIGLSVTTGLGTYSLTDMKMYQNDLITRIPVDARGTSNFPTYSNIRVSLFKQAFEGLKIGLTYAYSTTGAHANYTDYSGYLNLDQTIIAYQLGATASYRLIYLNFFEIMAYGDLRLGYIQDRVSVNMVTPPYYYERNSIKLSTITPLVEGGLEALYHFKKISLGLEGAYLFDIGNSFTYNNESEPDPSISLTPSQEIKSQMSGFRLGLKIIIWMNEGSVME